MTYGNNNAAGAAAAPEKDSPDSFNVYGTGIWHLVSVKKVIDIRSYFVQHGVSVKPSRLQL